MNWMKLKSSIITVATILVMSGTSFASTKQLADSVVSQSAEAILKMVLLHLPEQNPSSLNSYSAFTYHRFRIKTILSPIGDRLKTDITENLINQNNSLYTFSTETLTLQKRLKPDFNQSEILSARTEGKDDGSFTKLAFSLSEVSLLKPTINLFNKSYSSPFSLSEFANYDYISNDSIAADGDILHKISFQPKLGKHLDGFIGTALIDSKAFAVREIKAHSTQNDLQEPMLVIHQNFEQLNGKWLPSDINIKIFFKRKNAIDKSATIKDDLIAESNINIYQQQINPALSPSDFRTAAQLSSKTDPKPALSPNNYIYIPINQKDSISHFKTDSAIIAENRNQQTKLIRFITEGKIPLRYFNLDYNRLFGYNIFEGLKLGVGGETNRLLSKYITFGGYISYGVKNGSIRNGEWINLYPSKDSDLRFQLAYKDVNMELGEPEFLETKTLLNPESYRYLLIKNMYATKRYSTGVEYRPFKELDYYLFGDLSENHSEQNTQFLKEHPFTPVNLTRTGLQLRYTPGIVLQMEDGRQKEMNIPKSDFYLTIIQGLKVLRGDYQYSKIEIKGKFNLPVEEFGTSTIVFRGGIMTQDAPVIEYFNSYGSFAGTFSLAAPFSFGTMQLNEFSAGKYAAVHFRHDFSTWMFPKTFQKQPAIIFAQNIGFGQLNDQYQKKFNLQDYRKGFYESGFEVNNLLRMNYLSWGAGIYYRYGPYQFSSIHENFAYKFGFFFKL